MITEYTALAAERKTQLLSQTAARTRLFGIGAPTAVRGIPIDRGVQGTFLSELRRLQQTMNAIERK